MKTDNRSSKAVLLTVQGAMIAAVYVIITMAFAPFSFGPVQDGQEQISQTAPPPRISARRQPAKTPGTAAGVKTAGP